MIVSVKMHSTFFTDCGPGQLAEMGRVTIIFADVRLRKENKVRSYGAGLRGGTLTLAHCEATVVRDEDGDNKIEFRLGD